MRRQIEVVYEKGVLRPLAPLPEEIREQQHLIVTVEPLDGREVWLDAACVGASTPAQVTVRGVVPLLITAMGRHSRQMCRTNAFGVPDKAPKATSVVGGLVGVPVIAVPTSVGYGASFKGIAALLGMLNSCASNVSVVNIDNGFGGGYVASLINRLP